MASVIESLKVKDVRFPTSLSSDGSDAMHKDPDYSCAYVILSTDTKLEGHGFTFTLGKATEVVACCINALTPIVVGRNLNHIFSNFAGFWREITSESQMRWIGPEKGVIHLATAAIVNAIWDLWAKIEEKPLWKLLVDMEPEKLVSTIDFRYITDVITKEEAIAMLKAQYDSRKQRVPGQLGANYYPSSLPFKISKEFEIGPEKGVIHLATAAIVNAIWDLWAKIEEKPLWKLLVDMEPEKLVSTIDFRYITDVITKEEAIAMLKAQYDSRKQRVPGQLGANYYPSSLPFKISKEFEMVDANQCWDVNEAINWMKQLKEFNLLWIEEPTSPDDILGHATIAKALNPLKIGVATGEHCQNRVMFKQFMQAGALQFCQIDCCRLGGVNEVIAVYIMAAKFGIPVCPHAGGVGLCELVQHVAMWDYICLSGNLENRMIEYVDHLHEHFKAPIKVKDANYLVPKEPGYSAEMKKDSLEMYEYPTGAKWMELLSKKSN
ncbi:mitochondrial enolase superfamily member 1-like [Centruroides sculpturatus]|uniref:mitochondrial enolase superfamily member 1-like n=1 Tax=Centruroides sculpturatus TaxID=218467 RepID=UPI000C6EFF68|nr:mitochondrial enolase superfamily member 1-like [Centruroides sculpturatus]